MRYNFSRASMPGKIPETELHKFPVYRHVGLYAYRREQLLAFTRWDRTPYELAEGFRAVTFFGKRGAYSCRSKRIRHSLALMFLLTWNGVKQILEAL